LGPRFSPFNSPLALTGQARFGSTFRFVPRRMNKTGFPRGIIPRLVRIMKREGQGPGHAEESRVVKNSKHGLTRSRHGAPTGEAAWIQPVGQRHDCVLDNGTINVTVTGGMA
jgi:hypothetical protein